MRESIELDERIERDTEKYRKKTPPIRRYGRLLAFVPTSRHTHTRRRIRVVYAGLVARQSTAWSSSVVTLTRTHTITVRQTALTCFSTTSMQKMSRETRAGQLLKLSAEHHGDDDGDDDGKEEKECEIVTSDAFVDTVMYLVANAKALIFEM